MHWLSDPGNILILFLLFIGVLSSLVYLYLKLSGSEWQQSPGPVSVRDPSDPSLRRVEADPQRSPNSVSEEGSVVWEDSGPQGQRPVPRSGSPSRGLTPGPRPPGVGHALTLPKTGLDLFQIDPATVEMSADEMLSPLESIMEMLGKVKAEGNLSAEQRQYLAAAQAKGRRMMSQVEDIDLMLRMQQGPLAMKEGSFSVEQKLDRVVRAAHRMGRAGGVDVSFRRRDEGRFLVRADEKLFEKIIGHLLNSALRGVRRGAIEIVMDSRLESSPVAGADFFFLEEGDLEGQGVRLIRLDFIMPDSSNRTKALDTLARRLEKEDAGGHQRLGDDEMEEEPASQDVFALALARELTQRMGGELFFEEREAGRGAFVLKLKVETFEMPGGDGGPEVGN